MPTQLRLAAGIAVAAIVAVGTIGLLNRAPGVGVSSTTAPVATTVASPTDVVASPTTAVADWFKIPFQYRLPVGSAPHLVVGPTRVDLTGFLVGAGPSSPDDFGQQQMAAGARGITVLVVDGAVIHPCPLSSGSRVDVRDAPTDFLADLDTIGGITFAAPEATTIDDRPAIVTSFQAHRASCDGPADIHPLTGQYVQLGLPSRVFLVQVEGVTIMIQAWAREAADLAAWLPAAMGFVDAIHFVLDEEPTPSAGA